MLQVSPIFFGKLNGSRYDFPIVGDVLPMHSHQEHDAHISIVNKGSFKVHGNNWELTIVAGNVIDWPAYQEHEFIALEPDSCLINIVKGV
jgi:quercetin dioxygenase-like cupin family protein